MNILQTRIDKIKPSLKELGWIEVTENKFIKDEVTIEIIDAVTWIESNGTKIILNCSNYEYFSHFNGVEKELATLDSDCEWLKYEDYLTLYPPSNNMTTPEILSLLSEEYSSPYKFIKGYIYNTHYDSVSKTDIKNVGIGVISFLSLYEKVRDVYSLVCSYVKHTGTPPKFDFRVIGINTDSFGWVKPNDTLDDDIRALYTIVEYYVLTGTIYQLDWSLPLQPQLDILYVKLYDIKELALEEIFDVPQLNVLVAKYLFYFLFEKTQGRIVSHSLTSNTLLIFEGKSMKHCVGQEKYHDKVKKGELTIFSISTPDSNNNGYHNRATLSINKDGKWRKEEFFGPNNLAIREYNIEYDDLIEEFVMKRLRKLEDSEIEREVARLESKYKHLPEFKKARTRANVYSNLKEKINA